MGALFPRWTNTAFPLLVVCAVVLVGLVLVALMVYVRTPYTTDQFYYVQQPVEFDHRHHVRDDGIACEYCHTTVRRAATAGIPAVDVCMGCHSQIWNESPLLAPVRQAYFTGRPIRWERVHRLADFVFFNHAVHVTAGFDCSTCHGRVDQMALVYRVAPLTMDWCLDCHRDPKRALRNQRQFLGYASMTGSVASQLVPEWPDSREHSRLTTCSACHR